jgi:O-6-methylguanine DNA methyltransferase
MQKIYIAEAESSPLGGICLAATADGLLAAEIGADLEMFGQALAVRTGHDVIIDAARIKPYADQFAAYLNGELRVFDLPIDWSLITPFQRQVLEAQLDIPYGETRTYGQLAAQIGRPKAFRAVGRAGATNPIPLVIPCHRVIGADGSLRGYRAPGGTDTKAWLLALEESSTVPDPFTINS